MDNKFILIMLIIITVVLAVLFVWCIYTLIILTNNKLYCRYYHKKEWNLWEKIIKKLKEYRGNINISKFDNDPKLNSFSINIEIDSEKYKIIYWAKTRTASVHQGTKCTLCSYDKYHSDMAAKIMEEKIKKGFDNADERIKRMIKEMIGEQ